mmetsp:Transcript_16647/g.23449  ORF Transcript_16647/g.23449 Transcript_16647/m.23449 type:complete len:243 (+) Transcript_16647:141-869(+)
MVHFVVSTIAILASLSTSENLVHAAPNGALSCLPGVPFAPSSPHITYTDISTGSFADNGFQVFLNDDELTPETPFVVDNGETYTFKLKGTTDKFKGFLVRFGDEIKDFSGTLVPSSAGVQDNGICGDLLGQITHQTADLKDEITADFKVETAATNIPMDVTVVLINKTTPGSEYYNARFIITVPPAPTQAPTPSPTPEPTVEITPKPTPSPTPSESGGISHSSFTWSLLVASAAYVLVLSIM